MLLMRTTEDPADSVGELISSKQSLGLDHLSLAVHPLRFYGVKPRTLLGQEAHHDAYSTAAVFDLLVVSCNPTTHELALVPGGIVPDKKHSLLAHSFKPLAAPRKKLRGYGAHRTTVHEPQPSMPHRWQEQSIAGEGFRVGIVLSRLLLENSHRLSRLDPRMQTRLLEAAPPGLILETHHPLRMVLGQAYQPLESPFFLAYSGSGLSIHRLARSQRTPSRLSVARMVSPETRLCVSPCSKLMCAASASVQRLLSLPNSLGEQCKSSCNASAPSWSKAAWTSLGREEPGVRDFRPLSLNSWMALRTVCSPHPRFSATRGAISPRALARSIWQRRRTKALEDRRPSSSALRSCVESLRTKIGGFMSITVTHNPESVLDLH